jgi:hypothetical protein
LKQKVHDHEVILSQCFSCVCAVNTEVRKIRNKAFRGPIGLLKNVRKASAPTPLGGYPWVFSGNPKRSFGGILEDVLVPSSHNNLNLSDTQVDDGVQVLVSTIHHKVEAHKPCCNQALVNQLRDNPWLEPLECNPLQGFRSQAPLPRKRRAIPC